MDEEQYPLPQPTNYQRRINLPLFPDRNSLSLIPNHQENGVIPRHPESEYFDISYKSFPKYPDITNDYFIDTILQITDYYERDELEEMLREKIIRLFLYFQNPIGIIEIEKKFLEYAILRMSDQNPDFINIYNYIWELDNLLYALNVTSGIPGSGGNPIYPVCSIN